jgi:ABC-type nitrate/sulfonate/bicarbonate transport system ATPase subunit
MVTAAGNALKVAPEQSGAISIQNVRRVFLNAKGEETVALDRVNLEIQPGEMISLLGPSGCGKSTLMRIIAGLDRPDQGEVSLDGVPILGPNHERGLVFQDPTLFSWLTVSGNVSFGLKARGIMKEKGGEVDDYIRLVGLEGFRNAYPHQLSGGMSQRVALARALVNHPKVLLLDEPLGALDAFTRMQMQDEILRIWEDRGTTMVFVTHDVDEAIYMSDRIIVMTPRPGKIQELIEVRLSRPQARNHPDFFLLRSRILEILHFAGEIVEDENYYL